MSYFPSIEIFEDDTASAFHDWSIKFSDYVEIFGKRLSEIEKINRLKLYLGTHTRKIFENLRQEDKYSLKDSLKNIFNALNSPLAKEIAYKKLALCYQNKDENVSDFIRRLTPLVNSTSEFHSKEAKEETLCRCLIEKVRPELRKPLRLVGPLLDRKDFSKVSTYIQELEVLIQSEANCEPAIKALGNPNDFEQSSFEQFEDEIYEFQQISELNGPPYCTYCSRIGHTTTDCWYLQESFGQISYPVVEESLGECSYSGVDHTQVLEDLERENEELRYMVDELTAQVNELKMNSSTFSEN